ncbi:MAG: zinc ribbon domain-containing protein [Clostridiales bacterium]|nr:zinc ribbon domain-containing protein [Clostridiales bacterium]
MYCDKCGTKLPDDAVFCNMCGAKLQNTSGPALDPIVIPKTNGRRKKGGGVLAKTAVVLVALSLIAALGYVGLQMYDAYIAREIAAQKQEIHYATETVLHALVNADSETAKPFMTASMSQTFGDQSKAFEVLLGEDLRALTNLLGILIPGMDNLIDEIKSYEIAIDEYELASIKETGIILNGQMTFTLSIVSKPISLDFSAELARPEGEWLVDSWHLFKTDKDKMEDTPTSSPTTDQQPANSL